MKIAAIIAEWAYVEAQLELLFSASMGSHTLTDAGAAMINRNWVAIVAMSETDSIHQRLKFVKAGLVGLLPKDLQDQWGLLERVLRDRARERNLVAHTAWGISADYPEDLLCPRRGGQVMRYRPKDFDEILDRMSAAYVQAHDFLIYGVLPAQRSGRARTVSH